MSAYVLRPAITRTTKFSAHLALPLAISADLCGSPNPPWRLSAWRVPGTIHRLEPLGFHVKEDLSHTADRSRLAVLEKRGPTSALGCVDQNRDITR